jgi:pimeloyl-ACP methyl ester carboxylesterase
MGGAWLADDLANHSRLLRLSWGRAFVVDVHPASVTTPPLVLLHDVFETSFAFHAIVPALASTRRVIAPDLPGCGDSDHPLPEDADGYSVAWIMRALQELVGVLGVPRFDLLGQGFGASVAIQLAAVHPELVRRLVLVAPLVLTRELPIQGAAGLWPVLGAEVFRRVFGRADLRRVLEQSVSTPELLRPSRLNVYWDRLGRHGAREATHAMLEQVAQGDRLRAHLDEVHQPTLVVWGDRDALVPPEQGERLVELLADGVLEIVDGCGHAVAEERPDRLVELVLARCGLGNREENVP